MLVEQGLALSRARAQALIADGRVFVASANGRRQIKKASAEVKLADGEFLEIAEDADAKNFVSRGGLKLAGALDHLGLQVAGWSALDIGISTGGFADCLLQRNVAQVLGVDVGHGQLAERLRRDPRVKLFEGVNARDLANVPLVAANQGRNFDLVVIDVSFISLTLILPQAVQYLREAAPILALVKPQFEVGREGLGKNGIVKDEALFSKVEAKIRLACTQLGLKVNDYFASSIEGTDGNREFFIYAASPQIEMRF